MSWVQYLRNSKVSKFYAVVFDPIVLFEKQVLGFKISMEYFLIMKVVDCEGNLGNPVEYLWLSKVFALFLHLFDFGVHISELTIDHNDAQIALFVGEGVFIWDNVDVPEFLQNFKLIFDIFPFLLIDLEYFNPLEGIVIVLISDMFAQEDIPRRPNYIHSYPVPISLPISYSYINFITLNSKFKNNKI